MQAPPLLSQQRVRDMVRVTKINIGAEPTARVSATTSVTRLHAVLLSEMAHAVSTDVREEAPRATEAAAFIRQYHIKRVGIVLDERAHAEAASIDTIIPTEPRIHGNTERANSVNERKANNKKPSMMRTPR